ncbi:unnamed protein product [Pleuronectes platessa]|uniref:TIR domain-containing protein n=1 Tax=Pleuronectes platessa TaxID=8262 RepID=A0A9N7U218_PLEPL|nr:unnamed protein product [Pleuronectes platessa]
MALLRSILIIGMENAVCLDLSFNYMNQALMGGQFNSTKKMRGMGQSFEFLPNLNNLEVLSFANNAIGRRISRGLISSSVKYLYFSGNQLSVMWESDNNQYTHFFQNLTSLIYLDISNNNLTSISHEILCNLPGSIEALIISKNQLDYFPCNQAMRDWVYNELTVHLENFGHRRFSLCLEERDWIPGLSCIENLHSAVHNSVKTVFVLSSGSDGGDTVNGVIRQAFYMVQQRLLDEKVDTAVLVLLDEMFPKLKYLELRKSLGTEDPMDYISLRTSATTGSVAVRVVTPLLSSRQQLAASSQDP